MNIICHPSEYALRWSGIDLRNDKKSIHHDDDDDDVNVGDDVDVDDVDDCDNGGESNDDQLININVQYYQAYLSIAMTVGVCARNEVNPNNAVSRTNTAAFVPHLDGHLP
jgi:hypothetical protein